MGKYEKLLQKILAGTSDNNIRFSDLEGLLLRLGFEKKIRGSHHIFSFERTKSIINLQPVGSKAKGYQVKQVREFILRHNITITL
ncbi:MAG: hypothetical protein WBA23_03650 [Tunicatimonas sp.]|uniref:hypothetical protein n=1 Tax=Tunicatimonas sp. TaxID=1940096 RepID=UPI003C75F566